MEQWNNGMMSRKSIQKSEYRRQNENQRPESQRSEAQKTDNSTKSSTDYKDY
jgi:hypothetical protein